MTYLELQESGAKVNCSLPHREEKLELRGPLLVLAAGGPVELLDCGTCWSWCAGSLPAESLEKQNNPVKYQSCRRNTISLSKLSHQHL